MISPGQEAPSGAVVSRRHDVSLDVPETAGACDSAQLRTDLHLPQRLDTVPVNSLEVLTVRRQHGRKEEALVPEVLHDRVEHRYSVSTRVDATTKRQPWSSASTTTCLFGGGVVITEILLPGDFFSPGITREGSYSAR